MFSPNAIRTAVDRLLMHTMSCSIPARVFIVALCFVLIAIVFESLLARESSSQFTSPAISRVSAPVETDDLASILLKAIRACPDLDSMYSGNPNVYDSRCTPLLGVDRQGRPPLVHLLGRRWREHAVSLARPPTRSRCVLLYKK